MSFSTETAKAVARRSRIHRVKPIPDLDKLPSSALITREQVAQLFGGSIETLKAWSYGWDGKGIFAGQRRGPRPVRIEGMPRYRVGDVKAWLAGEAFK